MIIDERVSKLMNNIKKLRKEKGLTVDALASEIGVSKSSISLWENGRTDPRPGPVQKLADFFGVTKSYLLGYTPNRNNLDLTTVFQEIKRSGFKVTSIDENSREYTYHNFLNSLAESINEVQKTRERILKALSDPDISKNEKKQYNNLLNETDKELDPLIKKFENEIKHIDDITNQNEEEQVNELIELNKAEQIANETLLTCIYRLLDSNKQQQLIDYANTLDRLQQLEESYPDFKFDKTDT